MTMARFPCILAGALLLTTAAAGEVQVSLAPAEGPADAGGYAPAVLRVADDGAELPGVVNAAAVRWAEGGPTHLVPLAVAPGATQEARLSLPVARARQEFDVRLLRADGADAEELLTRRVAVRWPAEAVRAAPPIVDASAYRDAPRRAWPARRKLTLLALAVVAAAGMAATLFASRAWPRAGLLAFVVAAGTAGMTLASGGPGIERTEVEHARPERAGEMAGPWVDETLVAVSSLRTAEWRHAPGDLAPVYPSREALAADTAVVHPQRGLRLTLEAGAPRLFRNR